jgi:hypothetical protein
LAPCVAMGWMAVHNHSIHVKHEAANRCRDQEAENPGQVCWALW